MNIFFRVKIFGAVTGPQCRSEKGDLMKQNLWMTLLLAALVTIMPGVRASAFSRSSVRRASVDGYGWYCLNNDTHTPPELPSEFSFIEQYGGCYRNRAVSEGRKVIYLTFDAGYENGNVEKILNTLKKHGAQGAFFILGNLVTRNTALVERMLAEGHLVCNHTNRHRDMTKCLDEACFAEELEALNRLMEEKLGCRTAPFFRPPEGRFNENNLKWAMNAGYRTVFWSFAYADWDNEKQMDEEKALKKLLDHTHNGEILLLHPTSSTNAAILDRFLTKLEEEGYEFGSLYDFVRET